MSLRLKEIRIKKGFTQAKVADSLGCSTVAYSRYETGAREPSIDMLLKLSEIYGVSVDYILGKNNDTETTLSDYELSLIKAIRESNSHIREDVLDFLEMKSSKSHK